MAQYVPYQTLNLPRGGEEYADNCVLYTKYLLGRLNESWGIAQDIKPTSTIPYVGGVVLTKEGKFGHLAIIEKIEGDTLYLKEANYTPNKITTRELSVDSPLIRGYR